MSDLKQTYTIKKGSRNMSNTSKAVYDFSGSGGNVFAMLSQAKRWCRQLRWDFEPIEDDMKSGDYAHAVAVMREHFGELVEFIGDEEE